MSDEAVEEEKFERSNFDARQQFYKIWLACNWSAKQAMMLRNYEGWRMGVLAIYNHINPFFSGKEIGEIKALLDKADELIFKLNSANTNRSKAHESLKYKLRKEIENTLLEADAKVHMAMKNNNMLLPISQGDDVLTPEELFKRMGFEE